MRVIMPTNEEIAWRQCEKYLYTNYLSMPQYYSSLFMAFRSLLIEEHLQELQEKIKEIEEWVSDEYNKMNLDEMELRMFQNLDLLSGFQVNSKLITQMEIYDRLNQIKSWLTQLLYGYYMPRIRFTQQLSVD